jgi:uncharacterized metal-binding protein
MIAVVRPMPVLFACQGCSEFGRIAADVAAILDQRGFAESHWLGAAADEAQALSKARSRYPVYALDGCARRCARDWLASRGVKVQRHFILAAPGASAAEIAARIAEGW